MRRPNPAYAMAAWCAIAHVALAGLATAAHVPVSQRPSVRHAAFIARFDTLRSSSANEPVTRWLDEVARSPAARSDSGLRLLVEAHRATQLAYAGRRDEALELARRSIARGEQLGDTVVIARGLLSTALAHEMGGSATAARPALERLLRLSRLAHLRRFEGHARFNLAFLSLMQDRIREAGRGYRAALGLLSADLDAAARRAATMGLGRTLLRQRHVAEARATFATLVRDARRADDRFNVAAAFNNLAVLELLYGDPALALPAYGQSLAVMRRADRPNEIVLTACNLADANLRLGRNAQAQRTLEAERPLLFPRTLPTTRQEYFTRLGQSLSAQGRDEAAHHALDSAMAVVDSFHLDPGSMLLTHFAGALATAGRPGEAIERLDAWSARAAASSGAADEDVISVRFAAVNVLVRAGRAREAHARLEEMERDVETDPHAPSAHSAILAALAESHLRLGEIALARSDLRRAFAAQLARRERSQDVEWREGMATASAPRWGDGARALLVPLRGETRAGCARAAFDALQPLRALTLEERAGGRALPVTAERFQKRVLAPGEMWLELMPGVDSSLAFALTPRTLRAWVLPGGRELADRARRFRDLALSDDAGDRALGLEAAAELGRQLLGPVAGWLPGTRALLVSDGGLLAGMPWGLVVAPDAPQPLVERFALAELPAAATLARLRAAGALTVAPDTLVVIGGQRDALGRPLAGVGSEMRWLRGRYAACEVYTPHSRREANRALSRLQHAGVAHLSAHFVTDPENPWRSGMLLGDPASDDAYVRVRELAHVRSRVRLAVLAGCSSAAEGGSGAESNLGLSTGFLASGAAAVVGTRWAIEDAGAAVFMRGFYEALDAGLPAGEALRRAQRRMRADPGTASPAQWAGFVLLGDPDLRVRLNRRGWTEGIPAILPTGK